MALNDELIIARELVIDLNLILGVRIKYKSDYFLWKFTPKADRDRVQLIGRTIWIPSPEWEADNLFLAVTMIVHEVAHIWQRALEGFKYTLRWWFRPEKRLQYEMQAYCCNVMSSLVFSMFFSPIQEEKLVKILMGSSYMGMLRTEAEAIKMVQRCVNFTKQYKGFAFCGKGIPTEFQDTAEYQYFYSRGLRVFTSILKEIKERKDGQRL